MDKSSIVRKKGFVTYSFMRSTLLLKTVGKILMSNVNHLVRNSCTYTFKKGKIEL